jgi:hypothetical protein
MLRRMRTTLLLAMMSTTAAWADSPLTSIDFHSAYADVPEVRRALKGPSQETYAFLASDAPSDQKLAAISALGWEGDFATGFFEHLARAKGVAPSDLTPAQLDPSQRFVAGYLVALADYLELKPLKPGAPGVWGLAGRALLEDAARALPKDFTVQYALALVKAQAEMDRSWCEVFRLSDAVVKRFPAPRRNLRPKALEAAQAYLALYEESCEGSKAATLEKREALNQVYTVSRLGTQVVAGTQGGVVVWDPASPQPVATREGVICSGVTAGSAVWLGCEAEVLRWDGQRFTSFLSRKEKQTGTYYLPLLGPDGALWVRLGKETWAFDAAKRRFEPVVAPWTGAPYDVVFFQGRPYWIDFLSAIHAGPRRYPLSSAAYPGSDPRRLRVDGRGDLWVEDFKSGLFHFVGDRFTKQPGLDEKGAGVVVDAARQRTWLLHYTRGLVLLEAGAAPKPIDLSELEYVRDLLLDEKTGDVWVAGWNQVVRLRQDGPTWAKTRFRVK